MSFWKTITDSVQKVSNFASSKKESFDFETIAYIANAFQHYKATGEILIQDASVEKTIIPAIEKLDFVDAAALFGFKDHLLLLLHTRIKGQAVEAFIKISPSAILWKENNHQLVFSYSIERIEILNKAVKLTLDTAKDALLEMIPFGKLFGALASYAMGKTVKSVGLVLLDELPALSEQGVELKNGIATVSLDKQPFLSPLWLAPDLSFLPVSTTLLPESLSTSVSIAEMIKPEKIRMNREGIHINVKLSPTCEKVFSLIAELAKR